MRSGHDRSQSVGLGSGGINRRQLLRGSAALVAAPAFLRLTSRSAFAQDDIPIAKSSAKVNGKLSVLQDQDFHPDHNAFLKAQIEAFCQFQGWDYEVTDVAGFQGGGDLNQKLVASVQAGNAADLLIKDHQVRQLQFLGVLEPTTDLTTEMIGLYGDTTPEMTNTSNFDDQWWSVPFFTRAGGWYVRKDVLGAAGVDLTAGFNSLDQRRDAALMVSDAAKQMWGWGLTVNRSGDGTAFVQNTLYDFGSKIQDETGEVVTFNSPESIAALEWLKETYTGEQWSKMLPPGIGAWTDTDNNQAFLAGTLACTQNAGTMYAKAVFDKVPFAGEIAWMPYPQRNSDNAYIDLMGGTKFHVIKGTKNKDATSDLIRHLLTQPVQEKIWTISQSYALPAYKNGWAHELIQSVDNSKRAEPVVWNEAGFTGLRWPGPYNAAVDSVGGSNDHTDMMAEVLQGGDIAKIVEDYHKRWVQIWQDFGLKGE
ncbi:MAG TPA: extracellular solute-binding protein [Thermomicrobiales bacterium]|jgi:multiple sugar transport system substrate-binding protein